MRTDLPRRVRARAPVRVDFAGGWSDVPVFAKAEGGVVANAALNRYVHVDALIGGRGIRLVAEDLGDRVAVAGPAGLVYDGRLDLHKAALNMLPVSGGVELLTRSDVPPGSGLGASGALDVALVSALAHCRQEPYDRRELAELGFHLEAVELGFAGGRQDQYAAALGGWQELRFDGDRVVAHAIRPEREAMIELEAMLLVVYTGQSHFSMQTHRRVWSAFTEGRGGVADALRTIRDLGTSAADALRAGDWQALAAVVDANWEQQQRLDGTIATPGVRRVEAALRAAGVWGLKAAGAGAGGCFVAIVPPYARPAAVAAAAAVGARVLDCRFDFDGVTVWEESAPDTGT
jgi:D-glycero-alpha-D-manno-heptose-7-phosphate kinase